MIKGTALRTLDDITLHDVQEEYLRKGDVIDAAREIARYLHSSGIAWEGLRMLCNLTVEEVKNVKKE